MSFNWRRIVFFFGLGVICFFYAFKIEKNSLGFTVENKLGLVRKSETISIPMAKLKALVEQFGYENITIKDASNGKVLVIQWVDNDADGKMDELLFQSDFKAKEKKKFLAETSKDGASKQVKSQYTTFSRFVPERTDDYTWENDRVAFRTYGPVAQKMVEENKPGGTLTSGMDCWLKRVPYSIIDKWYKGNTEKAGFYHIDRGEGYDPYHVGESRGNGGIGVWSSDKLWVSKNFTAYKTIAVGPIRTIVVFDYAPWNADGATVKESKRISLDLGSNMTRYEVSISADKALPNVTVGITLHEKSGEVKMEPKAGYFRYWEKVDSSFIGTGLVIDPKIVKESKDSRVEKKDQSHILVLAAPQQDKLVYYAGFGWVKSGQFASAKDWDKYLAAFSQARLSPLVVKF